MEKKLQRVALKLDYWLAGICYYIFRLLPLQDKVVASAFRGRRYGDNPKFIVEELHRLNPEVDIVWLKNRHFSYELPPYIRTVSFYHHIQKAYELATARVWVYSHRLEGNIRKRKGQLFIETWHGGLGIKKIEGGTPRDTLGERDKTELGNTVKLADLFISNSDHLSGIYRRAFQYTGPIWKCGYPKNDIFFREYNSIRHKVRMTYGLSDDVKIMLYAPTFRDSFEQGGFDSRPYEIDLERVRNALSERFGGQWRILLRWHPVMAEKMEKNGFGISENVNDATEYPDMQELIVASDAFVSDYSSCIFDAALNGIPSYIYAADFDEYAGERGTYYSLEELPFPYAEDNDEMVANILAYDEEKYKNRWDDFSKRTGLFETGHAGNDIARLIHEFLSDNGISVFDFIKKATGSVDTSDFIPKKRKQTDKITIGLGVVREGLFSDNGIDMSREEMLAFWSELFAEIEKRGFDCKLFGNGALSDQKFLEDLLKYMRISRKDWEKVAYRRPVSVEELVDTINSFDGIIAGRLHAAVIAYSYNVPAVELVWNNKQLMFGQAIGFPERFVPASGSDVRHLVDLMERAIREGYNNEGREEYCRTTANFMKSFIKNYIN